MHCTLCGTPAPSQGALFCWKCGGRLEQCPSPALSYSTQPPLPLPLPLATPPLASPSPFVPTPPMPPASIASPSPLIEEVSVIPRAVPVPVVPERGGGGGGGIDVGVVPASMAASAFARLAPNASQTETIPLMFQEIDLKSQGKIALEDFKATLLRCKVRIPAADAAEMFRMSDADHDTFLNVQEFQHLCHSYPSLLTLLVDRTRLYWLDSVYTQDIDRERQALTSLREDRSRLADDGADAGTERESRTHGARVACQHAEAEERRARLEVEALADETHILRLRHREDTNRHSLLSERVAERTLQLQDAAAEREQSSARLRNQQDNVRKAQLRLDELVRAVEEQQREMSRLEERVALNQEEMNTLEEKHSHVNAGILEAQREADKHLQNIAAREAEIRDKEKTRQEMDAAHKDAVDILAKRIAAFDDAKQHESWSRESSRNQQLLNETALRQVDVAIEEKTQRLERLKQEMNESHTSRLQSDEAENASVQLEIRLKQQRLQLERQEAALVAGRHADLVKRFSSPQRLRTIFA